MAAVALLAPAAAACTGCPTALADGVLVGEGKTLVLRATTGETSRIVWPTGYSIREDSGKLLLVDWLGSVKAREGDHIQATGGLGSDDLFHACTDVIVVPP